jgi:hypothetical protein
MQRKNIERSLIGMVVAVGSLFDTASTVKAQHRQATGADSQLKLKSANNITATPKEGITITSNDVNKGIRNAYLVNSPVIRNRKKANNYLKPAPDKDAPFGTSLFFNYLGPN